MIDETNYLSAKNVWLMKLHVSQKMYEWWNYMSVKKCMSDDTT